MEVAGFVAGFVALVPPLVNGIVKICEFCEAYSDKQSLAKYVAIFQQLRFELEFYQRKGSFLKRLEEELEKDGGASMTYIRELSLEYIQVELDECLHRLPSKRPNHAITRAWFTERMLPKLEDLAQAIDMWFQRLTRLWTFVVMIRGSEQGDEDISEGIAETAELYRQDIVAAAGEAVPSTSMKLERLVSAMQIGRSAPVYWEKNTKLVVEYKKGQEEQDILRMVVSLAKRFAHVDIAHMSILRAKGFARDGERKYQLIFHCPEYTMDVEPRTLRTALLEPYRHPLNQRVNMVKQVATALYYIHAAGFVHKNIRPETTLLFYHSDRYLEPLNPGIDQVERFRKLYILGDAYLTGFTEVRGHTDHSARMAEDTPDRNIYRHPERQGIDLQVKYHFLHDIYSLGVLMVEVGLWFSRNPRDGDNDMTPFRERLKKTLQGDSTPENIRHWFISRAQHDLPRVMGQEYANLAHQCLTCVDEYNRWNELEKVESGTGDDISIVGLLMTEAKDANGVLIRHHFTSEVLRKLDTIHL